MINMRAMAILIFLVVAKAATHANPTTAQERGPLNREAIELQRADQRDQAALLAEHILQVVEDILGEDHSETAVSLSPTRQDTQEQRRPENAVPLLNIVRDSAVWKEFPVRVVKEVRARRDRFLAQSADAAVYAMSSRRHNSAIECPLCRQRESSSLRSIHDASRPLSASRLHCQKVESATSPQPQPH
jgi:hypothetical protein